MTVLLFVFKNFMRDTFVIWKKKDTSVTIAHYWPFVEWTSKKMNVNRLPKHHSQLVGSASEMKKNVT